MFVFINVLWYAYSVTRNKLLIIYTNPTGNNLTGNVFQQMLCTLSNKIFLLIYYGMFIPQHETNCSLCQFYLQPTGFLMNPTCFHLKFVTKSSLMYYGMLFFHQCTLFDGKISTNAYSVAKKNKTICILFNYTNKSHIQLY